MQRKEKICAGEHYHLYNRGVRREPIFLEDADRIRFLFLLLYCQLPLPLSNNDYHAQLFEKHGSFYLHAHRGEIEKALAMRTVELKCFVMMQNHFHLVVRARDEGGISKYLQRVQNAYTKYFNIKHKKEGHLFQGPFRAIRVGESELRPLSAYLHRNPRELREWRGKESDYTFSSFPDYAKQNRWGALLMTADVLRGESSETYRKFVEGSSAKSIEQELREEHLIED